MDLMVKDKHLISVKKLVLALSFSVTKEAIISFTTSVYASKQNPYPPEWRRVRNKPDEKLGSLFGSLLLAQVSVVMELASLY